MPGLRALLSRKRCDSVTNVEIGLSPKSAAPPIGLALPASMASATAASIAERCSLSAYLPGRLASYRSGKSWLTSAST
eukprot:scaffold84674_cov61-Phaeocystis_antarctica.AAC.5